MPGNLTRLADEALWRLFREQGWDAAVLTALNEELKRRNGDTAIDLHLEVAARRLELQAAARPPGARKGPVRDWRRDILARRGLSEPDGRPLYRYRLNDEEFGAAREVLDHLARVGRLETPDQNAGSIFVAYSAEWFRRESQSTFLKWDEIDPDLFPKVPYQSKQKLTAAGLHYWRRKLRTRWGARQFLLTLALEGGIPVRVVVDGADGWLREYLRAVLRRASNQQPRSHERIVDIAREERWRMSRSYDNDDFVEVCAEFSLVILKLREEAEAGGLSGISNSAILNATHPGWQEELPIHVPAENEDLAKQLLAGLLDEKLSGLATRGIEARRYLIRRDGEWTSAIQLLADGEIAATRLPGLSTQGRARVVPAGQLAEYMSGEVALLEPPAETIKSWRMRPLVRTGRIIRGFPIQAPVTAVLSSVSSAPLSWTWPGGEARHSDVLVFEEEDGHDGNDRLLRLVRSGSASLRAKTLHVLIPVDWEVETAANAQIVSNEVIAGVGRRLLEVTGTIYVRAPRETARYRIETDSQNQTIALDVPSLQGWQTAEPDEEVVATPFAPRVRDGKADRPAKPGEIYCRRPGERWSELVGKLSGEGRYEISLRDPAADIQIDKQRVVLLPPNAHLRGRMTSPLTGELRVTGMPGWSVSAPQLQSTEDPELYSLQFHGVPSYQLRVTLRPPNGGAFDVIVPVAGRDAILVLGDGSIVLAGAKVDISALRGALIVSPARVSLEIAPKGARSGGLTTIVDGEMPMGVLRNAMYEALASLSEQDDLLELAFLGDTRLPVRVTRYREQMLPLRDRLIEWRPAANLPATRPVVRMVLEPRLEHAMVPAGEGLWALPDWCHGPCMIYLRDGPDVVSRPRVLSGAPSPSSAGPLQVALSTPEFHQRQAAIAAELRSIAAQGDSAAASTKWLAEVIVHLRGLPASTIDALRLLPEHPYAAVAVLINAADNDRAAIWALQDELPLLWLAIPVAAWEAAIQSQRATLVAALLAAFPASAAETMANDQTERLREALITLEPALAVTCGSIEQRIQLATALSPINTLFSRYIASQHDRTRDHRNQLGDRLTELGLALPKDLASKAHTMFAGLFAPVLLAAAAAGRMNLTRDDMLLIRETLREDPVYVTSAWPHLLSHFGAFGK